MVATLVAEGVSAEIRYKAYTSGAMTPGTLDDYATDPANTGGQLLRRVSANLNLRKNTTRSSEILPSRQVRSSRHTSQRVEGSITGDLSPGTYFDFIEAAHRDTKASFVSKSESDYTSLAADESDSTLTLGGGDPVSDGLRAGMIITITGASVAANNRQFLIRGFSGGSNRVISVFPAPADMGADTAFGLARAGRSTQVAGSSHVARKFLIEKYQRDADVSRLFRECRVTGYRLQVPAEGNAEFEAMFMGRQRTKLATGSSPFFGSPSAITTTNIVNSLEGAVYVGSTRIGLITGLTLNFSLSASAPSVLGQDFPSGVILGTASLGGNLTFLADDEDALADAYEAETELTMVGLLTSGDFASAHSIGFCMPRFKLNNMEEQTQGEAEQVFSAEIEALEYTGATAGLPASTFLLHDTSAS